MDDLLKDAIADAKAVRETALENAKIALEEAFTPRLQSMLSKKIQSEIEDEDDIEERDDEDEDPEERMDLKAGDEDPSDDHSEEDMDEIEDDEDDEPKMDMESVIEIDGVKYAPVVSEEEDEDEMDEIEDDEDDMDESDDFDLDEILKELEEEEDEDDDKKDEVTEEEDEDKDKKDVDEEVDQSSGIGSSENSKGSADKSSGIGSKDKAKFESVEVTEEKDEDGEEVDEDIDLEEIVKALSEEEDEEEKKDENSKLQSELEEHRNVVKYLRSKLNEVNLLNAKLLFTNKLFRSHGLSNDQKMKVVETFDRAHNLREVKLVYSTLAESFGSKQTKTEIKESKGSASKAVASTKSEKQEVIAEGHEMRDRFKKLAGIL
mgnify:CR=1 FL=1|jgi:hypothetical protein